MRRVASVFNENANEVMDFVSLAFRSYLSARTLLRERKLVAGAIAASECIEKYFKAIIIVFGSPNVKLHLSNRLVAKVRLHDPKLIESLNGSFLEFLQKCYDLRYPDNLPMGFNIRISQRMVLAELDYTVSKIESAFKFENSKGEVVREIDRHISTKNLLLINENYIHLGMSKSDFISQRDCIFEMRKLQGMRKLEAAYETDESKDDGQFMKEALVPS